MDKKIFILWEIVGYITLLLCVIGQITVGYMYIFAQISYLLANVFVYICSNIILLASVFGVIRDLALKLPKANLIKDIVLRVSQ